MRPRPLLEVARMMHGRLIARAPVAARGGLGEVRGASIDSRTVSPGDLFFALPGARVHGKDYASAALARGAAAVVIAHPGPVDGAQVLVPDPARALALLAATVRREEHETLPAAAITGSVGKTTTCRWASELLGSVGVCHRPPASFNNALGVPLTLLGAPDPADFLLLEIGTNAPGEVLPLALAALPRVACVTAVEPAHLAAFGDLEAIAREKLSILRALPADGEGWIPARVARDFAAHVGAVACRLRTFGPGGDLEIAATAEPGEYRLRLGKEDFPMCFPWRPPFPHSPSNLEAALAVAAGLGVPPEALLDQIPRLTLPPLRGETRSHGGVDLLLDCYNSSPASLASSIERLAGEPAAGRRFCVVGTMEELGSEERQWHRRLGKHLAATRIDVLCFVGRGREWFLEGARDAGREGVLLMDDEPSAELLAGQLQSGDRVLFKASRRVSLERFAARVARLLDARGERG